MNCEPGLKKTAIGLYVLVSIALATSLSFNSPAFAQAPPQNGLAMILLPVQPGPHGTQYATTPRGMRFPLPGAGVNGNTVQVYTGPQGGYWYVDRTGNSVSLLRPGQPMPNLPYYGQTSAYAPPQQPTNQTVNVNNTPSSGSSGAGAAMMAGAAGMMGGMAMGAAMNNNNYGYGGVPYGHPVYYGGAGSMPYYYGAGGSPVYVNNSKAVNVSAMQNQQNWYHNTVNSNQALARQWQNSRAQQMSQQTMAQQGHTAAQQAANAENSSRRGFRGRRLESQGANNPATSPAAAAGAAQQAEEKGGLRGFRGRRSESQGANNAAASTAARGSGAAQHAEEKGGRRGLRGRNSEPQARGASGAATAERGGERGGRRRALER